MPAPTSIPVPVSASPPSRRTPSSRLGLKSTLPSVSPVQAPSTPSLTRCTCVFAAARFPAPFSASRTASEFVRTPMTIGHRGELGSRLQPGTRGARFEAPRAAMARLMSVSRAGCPVRDQGESVPLPYPATPQRVSRLVESACCP